MQVHYFEQEGDAQSRIKAGVFGVGVHTGTLGSLISCNSLLPLSTMLKKQSRMFRLGDADGAVYGRAARAADFGWWRMG